MTTERGVCLILFCADFATKRLTRIFRFVFFSQVFVVSVNSVYIPAAVCTVTSPGYYWSAWMGGLASKPVRVVRPVVVLHEKARCPIYPRTTDVLRFPVPDNKVSWRIDYPQYKPVDYTAPSVLKQPVWADVDVRTEDAHVPNWNGEDGKVNRVSHLGRYEIDNTGCPRNPMGRTGVVGRGVLGRWGPNHAADPIVTRWKRDSKGKIVRKSGLPVAQFIAIQRRDNQEWAIPGGMVETGEVVTMTIRREFREEAMNALQASEEEKREIEKSVNDLFAGGVEIYRGYVDDPRNTDNAWMETVAMNFHDDLGDSVSRFRLHAGDDAVGVQWMDLDSSLQLFASHTRFLQQTAARLNASW